MKKKIVTVMMGVLLSAAVLSGCDSKDPNAGSRGSYTGAAAKPTGAEADPLQPGDPGQDPAPTQAEDGVVYVDNVPDLIQAIKPNAKIVVKAGDYNISDYIQDVWNNDPDLWNKNHKYVEIREVYDGVELVIRGAEGLDIRGESNNCADVEFVTDPRYAAVMTFDGCDKLVLSNLTMGHTDRGECWGSVIELVSCDGIALTNMDLYGCGVIGLNLEYCSGVMHCNDVTIRECSMGPLSSSNSRGEWKFYNCKLIDSLSGGFFGETNGLSLYFEDCVFGDRETENFQFRNDTTTKNCTWGDPSTYPDYGYYQPTEMHKSDLKIAAIDSYVLQDKEWIGFEVADDVTGEIVPLDRWIYFFSDGSGMIYEGMNDRMFTWQIDSAYGGTITMDDNSEQYGITVYYDQNDPNTPMFLDLSDGKDGMWFY